MKYVKTTHFNWICLSFLINRQPWWHKSRTSKIVDYTLLIHCEFMSSIKTVAQPYNSVCFKMLKVQSIYVEEFFLSGSTI